MLTHNTVIDNPVKHNTTTDIPVDTVHLLINNPVKTQNNYWPVESTNNEK